MREVFRTFKFGNPPSQTMLMDRFVSFSQEASQGLPVLSQIAEYTLIPQAPKQVGTAQQIKAKGVCFADPCVASAVACLDSLTHSHMYLIIISVSVETNERTTEQTDSYIHCTYIHTNLQNIYIYKYYTYI